MMEERTIAQLPIESLDGMIEWYERHLIFCMKHELICFEHAYHEATKQYPAFIALVNKNWTQNFEFYTDAVSL